MIRTKTVGESLRLCYHKDRENSRGTLRKSIRRMRERIRRTETESVISGEEERWMS